MRQKTTWVQIFGKDADLLSYCQRRGAVTPTLEMVIDFIDQYEPEPDADFPQHRKRLSKTERLWLERLVAWRFGYKTFDQDFPSLSYWCGRLDVTMRQIIRAWRFLLHQGLLALPAGYKRGLALRFDAQPLLDKVRSWLGLKRKQDIVTELLPEVEAVALVGPEEEEEPEPEELPEAAMVAAPEWDTALRGIVREIGEQEFIIHFTGIRACWRGGQLVLLAAKRDQWEMLTTRFLRVIRRHLAGYDLSIPCPARSSA